MGVELMANSDNVLRGGLTNKPVDVDALLEIVETTPQLPAVQRPAVIDGVAEYESPAPEFSLRRFEIDDTSRIATSRIATSRIETAGPAVVLCVSGSVDAGTQTLDRGEAAWIPAADPPVSFTGRGTVFRAGVGDFALH
jgi:mannose-6-phosphate isomerase